MPPRQQHRKPWPCCLLNVITAVCLAAAPAAVAAHSSRRPGSRPELLGLQPLSQTRRSLLVEEFKSAPPAEEKEAEAEKVISQRPDKLLRNLKIKDQGRIEMFPEGCAVSEVGKSRRVKVLTEGSSSPAESAAECAASCKAHRACNAWFWCNDQEGCETETGDVLINNACQLQTQRLLFPIEPPLNWKAARFVAGYEGVNVPKKAVPPELRVAVVAPITLDTCPLAYGTTSLKQAFINKHDYARLHSYEFLSKPVLPDPAAPGTWYRLLLLKQALAEVPAERAGWLLFVDQDVLVDEMAFTLPFKQYADVDLVLWGSRKLIAEDAYQKLLSVSHKDRQQGLDTGVLLLRNSDWSRAFVADALEFLTNKEKEAMLKRTLKTWEPLLFEQNAIAFLLQDPERLERVRFETEYCINCAWAHGLQGKLPFIKRFSECSFCTGFRNSREQMYECNSELVRTFGFSNRMALGIIGCGQQGGKSDLVNPTDPGPRERAASSSSGSATVTARLQSTAAADNGPNPIVVFASFMRTHAFTMIFITIFFCGFVRRRRRRPAE